MTLVQISAQHGVLFYLALSKRVLRLTSVSDVRRTRVQHNLGLPLYRLVLYFRISRSFRACAEYLNAILQTSMVLSKHS